jgi:hypothetical protein
MENLKKDVKVIAEGNSLADVISKFENLPFKKEANNILVASQFKIFFGNTPVQTRGLTKNILEILVFKKHRNENLNR